MGDGQGVEQQLLPGRMGAQRMAEERVLRGLVERDPLRHPVSQAGRDDGHVVGETGRRVALQPVEIRRQRAATLRSRASAALDRFLDTRVGAEASILIEQEGVGRDETYAPVVMPAGYGKGSIVNARIAAARNGKLWLEAA